MGVLLAAKENNSHTSGDDDDETSHHLVDRGSHLGEGDEHEGRAADIEGGGDRQKKRVDFCFQLCFLRHLGARRKWNRVFGVDVLFLFLARKQLHDKICKEAAELTNKHVSALEEGMVELFAGGFVDDDLILSLHDDGVAGTEDQHENHDCVKLPRSDFVFTLTHLNKL